VSLTISAKEIVCLVGPSGSGKSTLLNILAGFDTPTSGTVTVDGVPVRGAAPDRRVVFQTPALFPWLAVLDNIVFGPRKRSVPAAPYRPEAQEHIRAVGLEKIRARMAPGGVRLPHFEHPRLGRV
jgi:NitT/TauT family transport system ATP-binding protein